MREPAVSQPQPLADMLADSLSWHESFDVSLLPSRLDELADRLRRGERFVLTRDGEAVAALVSLLEMVDLDETDAVLADQGLLDQLREARAASEDPASYEP